MRERQAERLDTWLESAAESDIPEWRGFALGVKQGKAAVQSALSLPWSNGPTEGHINRLKLIKRQMYGRAKFDLLR